MAHYAKSARQVGLKVAIGSGASREVLTFYLDEEQATLVVMFSRTPKAAEARREIIAVFTAWRCGELEQAVPKLPQTYLKAVEGLVHAN